MIIIKKTKRKQRKCAKYIKLKQYVEIIINGRN